MRRDTEAVAPPQYIKARQNRPLPRANARIWTYTQSESIDLKGSCSVASSKSRSHGVTNPARNQALSPHSGKGTAALVAHHT